MEIADGALNPEPAEATAPQFPNPSDPAPLPLLPIDPAAVEEDNPVANPAATDVGEVESQGMGSGGEPLLLFFIYDFEKSKSESDDPLESILYFHPNSEP
ncbi:hypothetical protein DAPPUDRAFT_343563, partial [Daphnia pulex]